MKKIQMIGVAVLALLAVGVVSVASASATTLQWLKNGLPIGAAQASTTEGEILLANPNGGGLGVKVDVLCSGKFDGTVGPGVEDLITEVLDLTGAMVISLTNLLVCTNIEGCENPLAAPVNLPWLTELELMGTEAAPLFLDKFLSAGFGNPGWEIDCTTVFGLIEETCTNPIGADLENDGTEMDVLGSFLAEGELALCSGNNAETGEVVSDAPGLTFLNGGGTLAVSYE